MASGTTGDYPKVNWAASLGDRSENADYKYNKQILRKIDRRVRYLGKRLEELKIIDFSPEQTGKVYFGAWVEIENEQGELKTLRVVGVDEIYDHHPQHISIDSPMARALLGKQVNEEIEVVTPLGKKYGTSIVFVMKCAKISPLKIF